MLFHGRSWSCRASLAECLDGMPRNHRLNGSICCASNRSIIFFGTQNLPKLIATIVDDNCYESHQITSNELMFIGFENPRSKKSELMKRYGAKRFVINCANPPLA